MYKIIQVFLMNVQLFNKSLLSVFAFCQQGNSLIGNSVDQIMFSCICKCLLCYVRHIQLLALTKSDYLYIPSIIRVCVIVGRLRGRGFGGLAGHRAAAAAHSTQETPKHPAVFPGCRVEATRQLGCTSCGYQFYLKFPGMSKSKG